MMLFPLIPLLRREATILSLIKGTNTAEFPLIPLLRREATAYASIRNSLTKRGFPLIPLLRREATLKWS